MNNNRPDAPRRPLSIGNGRGGGGVLSPSPKGIPPLGDGPARNPLIDDLFDDLSTYSNSEEVSRLQGESISNRGSFSEFPHGHHRLTAANSINSRSCLPSQQSKAAIDMICKTSQHFVHAMRMHELDGFFTPRNGQSAEEVLRGQLRKKTPQDVEQVVQVLVELLEDVRRARAEVSPLCGSLQFLDGRERAMSASMFSTVSTASLMRPPVHETNQLAMAYDPQGNRMINCYTIIANLGQGAYGKVKLGRDASTGNNVAIKIIDKKHLKKKIGGLGANDQDAALKREIAIMKKVRHRCCVSLYEVIDDPASNKLYLIMDYVPNGPVVRLKPQQFSTTALTTIESNMPVNGDTFNRFLMRCAVRQRIDGGTAPLTAEELAGRNTVFTCRPVAEHDCALYLRQLVSGLRYMHKRNLVHHDIKPDNILLGADHQVFFTDFGVSEILSVHTPMAKVAEAAANGSDDSLPPIGEANEGHGGCGPRLGGGTLLFTSPELFDTTLNQSEVDPFLTDVWALGVTLYCMLVGITPFFGNTLPEVRRSILNETYPWNGHSLYETSLASEWRPLLDGLLEKDPKQRWTLQVLKQYLDQDSFQETMRHSAMVEAASRAASRTALDASTCLSPKYSRIKASRSMAQTTLPPPPSLRPHGDSTTSRSKRLLSSSDPLSVLSFDSAGVGPNFLLGFDVSQAELSQATRAAKVEVTEHEMLLSAHTRATILRWVNHIRARLRERNVIQVSVTSSPFSSAMHPDPTTSAKVFVAAGRPNRPPGSAGTVGGASGLQDVPVLTVAGAFHRTTQQTSPMVAAGGGTGLGPLVPVLSSNHGGGRAAGYAVHSNRSSGSAGDAGATQRVRNYGSASIDAILSIVNLQSTSNPFSHSCSFGSSSNSRGSGELMRAPVVTETVPGTAALIPPAKINSGDESFMTSREGTPTPSSGGVASTRMWCGSMPSPSMVNRSSPSASPENRDLHHSLTHREPTVEYVGSRHSPHSRNQHLVVKEVAAGSTSLPLAHTETYVYDAERPGVAVVARKLRDDTESNSTADPQTSRLVSSGFPMMSPRSVRGASALDEQKRGMQQRLSNRSSSPPVLSSLEHVSAVERPAKRKSWRRP